MEVAYMAFDIKVNGGKIKSPFSLQVELNPITDGERLLGGNMSVRGIAGKYKLTLTYKNIKKTDMSAIIGATWEVFRRDKIITQTVTFPDIDGVMVTINTYFSPTSYTITPSTGVTGRVEDVKLSFIEL
jgi:hypothetical protein